MSTRSTIAIKKENGEIDSVYCHSDGYPSHNGDLLLTNYNSEKSAKEIVALGGISFLDKNLSPSKKLDKCRYDWREKGEVEHSFDTPHVDTTTFYHRDRGEDLDVHTCKTEKDFHDYWNSEVDYLYLWKDGKWFIDGNELTEEMVKED